MPTITPSKARFGIAISALVGLFASAYLFYTYVTGAPIACGIVSGCEAVRASKWATTVFNLPRPVLGLVFYDKKGAQLEIDEKYNCFWYHSSDTKLRIDSSVKGVFLRVVAEMTSQDEAEKKL
jgi:hypothetical protein